MRHFVPDDKLIRVQDLISTDLDQETVVMSIDAGVYYGLDRTARRIWEHLANPVKFSDLVERLVQEYGVEPETCAVDIQSFLAELEREGLISVE